MGGGMISLIGVCHLLGVCQEFSINLQVDEMSITGNSIFANIFEGNRELYEDNNKQVLECLIISGHFPILGCCLLCHFFKTKPNYGFLIE